MNSSVRSFSALTFTQDDLTPLRNIFHGVENVVDLIHDGNFPIDVSFGVALRNNDGRHGVVTNVIQFKMFLDQTNVLVDAQSFGTVDIRLDFDVLLSDGFHKTHFLKALFQTTHNGQGRCRFADVLPGGGDKNGTLKVTAADIFPEPTAIGEGFPRG